MKVGFIGAGTVGLASLMTVVMQGFARKVVVLDRDQKKTRGVVTDIRYGVVLSPDVEVGAGDYANLKGASLVMITNSFIR